MVVCVRSLRIFTKVTYLRGEGRQSDDEKGEPGWLQDFCNVNAKQYVIHRCEFLMQAGKYRDIEAIQMEFDF